MRLTSRSLSSEYTLRLNVFGMFVRYLFCIPYLSTPLYQHFVSVFLQTTTFCKLCVCASVSGQGGVVRSTRVLTRRAPTSTTRAIFAIKRARYSIRWEQWQWARYRTVASSFAPSPWFIFVANNCNMTHCHNI